MIKPNRTKFNPVTLDHPVNRSIQLEQMLVTPELALSMLAHNENNRNLRPKVVASYARDMANGDWMLTAETVKFDWHGRLIDGQHRLHAVIESESTVPMTIARNLDPESQTVLDMGARRTAADALSWNGMATNPTVLAAAARLALADEAGQLKTAASQVQVKVTNSEVLTWVESNQQIFDAVALGMQVYKGIGGTPSAFSFIAFKLMQVDHVATIEFLTSTAEFRTDGLRDPRSSLIKTFARLKNDRVRVTPAMQVSLTFRAWNAWRVGRSMNHIPVDSRGAGVAIPEPK